VYVDLESRLWSLEAAGGEPQLHGSQPGLKNYDPAVGASPNRAWIAAAIPEKKPDDPASVEFALYLWNLNRADGPQRLGSVDRVNSSPHVAFADNRYVILGGDDTMIWSLDDLNAAPALMDGEFVGVNQSQSDSSTYLVVTNRALPPMNNGDEFIAIWNLTGRPAQSQLEQRIPYLGGLRKASLVGDAWLILRSEMGDQASIYPLKKEFFSWLTMHLKRATDVALLPRHRRRYLGRELPGDAIR
jgi:hypothetical protein